MRKYLSLPIVTLLVLYKWELIVNVCNEYLNLVSEIVDVDHFLKENGYPLEVHQAHTEDGYILTLHRISHGRNEESANKVLNKPPVFIMHGLLCSSMDFIILGPERAIPLILADAGYDVWLGNNRGNTYSRKHISLNPDIDVENFFDYSYHEIGLYDLPAMIDYVLNATGYKQLTYIGYSEGFTSFTVMCSMRPEYNKKILLMNAYAPVTNMYQIASPLINMLARYPQFITLFRQTGWYEMFTHRKFSKLFQLLCSWHWLCNNLFLIIGMSKEQLPDQEFLKSIFINFPAGMSLKQLTHYVQGTQTGIYRPFDFGREDNLKIYGTPEPDSYDLTKVTAPIILYYGEGDYFINNDILLNSVAKDLPNVIDKFLVPYSKLNHLDFLYGKNISLLTDETLKNINKFNRI